MTVREKAELIVKDIKKEQGTNPVVIFKQIAEKEYISIHGPEHHILDGASLLVAYKNAGGEIDLEQALDRLMSEGLRMPGAMCGLWGICGAITSIGAALAIIDGTGPLSTDGTWGNHMQFTSKAIGELGAINGPRCCKRDAMIAFKNGIDYVNAHYGVTLQYEQRKCGRQVKKICHTKRKRCARMQKRWYFQLVHQMMALHSIFLAEVFLHRFPLLRLAFST